MMFSPFRSINYTNPPPPLPPFWLTLNQSPKDIAGSDITNCLTHAIALKLHDGLCRHWRLELILSCVETYHLLILNRCIVYIAMLLVAISSSELDNC